MNSEADMVETSSGISVREAGRRGGTATRDRHGIGFYRQIGARGGETTKTRWGHLFSQMGKKGGRRRRPNLENTVGDEVPSNEGG